MIEYTLLRNDGEIVSAKAQYGNSGSIEDAILYVFPELCYAPKIGGGKFDNRVLY